MKLSFVVRIKLCFMMVVVSKVKRKSKVCLKSKQKRLSLILSDFPNFVGEQNYWKKLFSKLPLRRKVN